MIHFLWPDFLWGLLLLPLLAGLYLWLLHRKRKEAVRYASLALVKQALGTRGAWRRHVPPVLMGLALTSLLVAVARPAARIALPSEEQLVILAMDVSGSMRATDVLPSRLAASQMAAKEFVQSLPARVRVGVVSFAGTASVVQAPTLSRDDVLASIDRFQLQRATAIGSGIIVSLATIFPDAGIEISNLTGGPRDGPRAMPWDPRAKPPPEFRPVPPGSYSSAVIILLTDGQRTMGPDPLEAAQMAADRGVKVYTVGFGTTNGEITSFDGWSMRVRLDEEALKAIATITHGEYFYAGSAVDLQKVYKTLGSRLVVEKRETEVTALFAALGALLAATGAALSVWWFGRVL